MWVPTRAFTASLHNDEMESKHGQTEVLSSSDSWKSASPWMAVDGCRGVHVQTLGEMRELAASSGAASPAITAGSGQVPGNKAVRKPLTRKRR